MKSSSHLKRHKAVMFIISFILRGVKMGFFADVTTVSRRMFTSKYGWGKNFSEFSFEFGAFPLATGADLSMRWKTMCKMCPSFVIMLFIVIMIFKHMCHFDINKLNAFLNVPVFLPLHCKIKISSGFFPEVGFKFINCI